MYRLIQFFFKRNSTTNYIEHCKKIFYKKPTNKKLKNIILVEFNNFHILHLIFPYLISFFNKNNTSQIVAYHSHYLLSYPIVNSLKTNLKILIANIFSFKTFGIYKSFGVDTFLKFKLNKIIKKKVNKQITILRKQIKTKDDILKVYTDKIYVGDLIYDTFLKKNYSIEPTINIEDKEFWEFLREFYILFFNWQSFFNTNKIKVTIASHCTYTIGLPLRFCVKKNGKSLVVKENEIIKITKDDYFQTAHYKYFSKTFSKFKNQQKKNFLKIAKKSLDARINGSVKDIPYITNSSFKKNKIFKNIFSNSRKFKILIAPHDFVDGPHFSGNFIFPDMFEWIKFLVQLSKDTQFEWYLKLHPKMDNKWRNYQNYTSKVIDNLCYKSNIKILDRNTSHNDIIQSGINLALTVNGTIAHEYAAKGINVINASKNNPHSSYDFNLHAKNIAEYRKMILRGKNLKNKIDKNKVYEYYFMRYIFKSQNWFFEDYNKFLSQLGNYHDQWTKKTYDNWIENYDQNIDRKIFKKINKFINSNDLTYYIKDEV